MIPPQRLSLLPNPPHLPPAHYRIHFDWSGLTDLNPPIESVTIVVVYKDKEKHTIDTQLITLPSPANGGDGMSDYLTPPADIAKGDFIVLADGNHGDISGDIMGQEFAQ